MGENVYLMQAYSLHPEKQARSENRHERRQLAIVLAPEGRSASIHDTTAPSSPTATTESVAIPVVVNPGERSEAACSAPCLWVFTSSLTGWRRS